MKSAAELEKNLMSINRRSYPAYKDLRGSYQFQGYQLNIDHVQGGPFCFSVKAEYSGEENPGEISRRIL